MKFYNRETEISQLEEIWEKSLHSAQMTFVIGRRRVGKTMLLKKAFENQTFLYFFVAKKSETLLCAEFIEEIKLKLKTEIFGNISTFKDLFGLLMNLSKERNFTLVIDEFQEFYSVNSSIYSDMQNIWDHNKNQSKLNLILCGSVYSLMSKIFEDSKEPLFGRANHRMTIKKFDLKTLKKIYADEYADYLPEDLLTFYSITGGVAKYVEILVEAKAFTYRKIINEVFKENSLFLEEGKNVLIDEFGKEYGNYFSILSLIASSKTSRPEIESILEINVGGFLERLENAFGLITKVTPVFSKTGSRNIKYRINDNFLNFWFRFIYKYQSAIEIENLQFVKQIVERDYKTFSGKMLENYFVQKLAEEKKYSKIGTYWEKGNLNEIDIVAENEWEKKILFAEVKRKREKINLNELQKKTEKLMLKFPKYTFEYQGFSLENM